MIINESDRPYFGRYYATLVGHTITESGFTEDGFPYFIAEKGGESICIELMQDPEGNGPGFLGGLPEPRGGA